MKFIWTDHLSLCILQSATITLLAHEQQVSNIKNYYELNCIRHFFLLIFGLLWGGAKAPLARISALGGALAPRAPPLCAPLPVLSNSMADIDSLVDRQELKYKFYIFSAMVYITPI